MCEVSGGYPQPLAKVMIGDEDITNQFNGTQPVLQVFIYKLLYVTHPVTYYQKAVNAMNVTGRLSML